jgi:hypothetical protein
MTRRRSILAAAAAVLAPTLAAGGISARPDFRTTCDREKSTATVPTLSVRPTESRSVALLFRYSHQARHELATIGSQAALQIGQANGSDLFA